MSPKSKAGRHRRGILAVAKLNWSIIGELKAAIEAGAIAIGVSPSFLVEQLLLLLLNLPTNIDVGRLSEAKNSAKSSYEQTVKSATGANE